MNNMYPHRAQQPPPNRLGELLDQVRAEFEAQSHRSNDYDQASELLQAASSYLGEAPVRWLHAALGEMQYVGLGLGILHIRSRVVHSFRVAS